MQVPQLPASQENGGVIPARRALSSSVSPGRRGTDACSLSNMIVTWPPVSLAAVADIGSAVM
ncbi:serine/threonine-protein kinase ATR [Mycolicibacterium brisbanense]|uniref:Serine/threonine-protein kinase ATR n=1 Tax=Mycolicibacterium brisbanense TaxID=146020 RepID=A0A124E143_9MYCO|nr:serine/threonine-protein kinase ATR [Mycolicibacterium brisbanense]